MIQVTVHTILGLKEILGRRQIEMTLPEGCNLAGLLARMVERWGEKLSFALFEPGACHPAPHIRLMVNGRDIAFLEGMDTTLRDGDEVLLFPPVAGG